MNKFSYELSPLPYIDDTAQVASVLARMTGVYSGCVESDGTTVLVFGFDSEGNKVPELHLEDPALSAHDGALGK